MTNDRMTRQKSFKDAGVYIASNQGAMSVKILQNSLRHVYLLGNASVICWRHGSPTRIPHEQKREDIENVSPA
ncbi:MAG: hypothetical protein KatS3mg087_1154 [Patescibacteria group bacterium]|nr:MAG: hypothetical protein KatS3mg087_1154 [Patescibacteria group bacterium]